MMKKLMFTFFALSTMLSSANSTGPNSGIYPIIKTAEITVSLIDISQKAFFENAGFDYVNDNLEFQTTKKIKYIQIFSEEGKLKFQIPVMSKSVFISRKLFKPGFYKLGFMLEGHDTIEFTTVEAH